MQSGYPKQGSGGFSALPLSDYVDCKSLGAGVNEDITVPARAHFAIFGGTADFYAKRNGSAAVPTDIADGSGSVLNPYIVAVEPGDVIGLISAGACLVTIAYYGRGKMEMLGQPVARVGSGKEDSARELLNTVASVAADPDGYRERLAQLDEAQAKALERETAARAAERDAQDALDTLRTERQALEAERVRAREEKDAGLDDIRKARVKHDAVCETERAEMRRQAEVLGQRIAAADRLQSDLAAKIEIHTKATAEHETQRRKAEALNAELTKALEAANAREAAAARAIARVKALANEAP